ncbi:MAG: hypothetical protein K2F99_01325 [Muribaculaceae bacterium]|nr:hypothetical protein [Muribaculaceae bacterium]
MKIRPEIAYAHIYDTAYVYDKHGDDKFQFVHFADHWDDFFKLTDPDMIAAVFQMLDNPLERILFYQTFLFPSTLTGDPEPANFSLAPGFNPMYHRCRIMACTESDSYKITYDCQNILLQDDDKSHERHEKILKWLHGINLPPERLGGVLSWLVNPKELRP